MGDGVAIARRCVGNTSFQWQINCRWHLDIDIQRARLFTWTEQVKRTRNCCQPTTPWPRPALSSKGFGCDVGCFGRHNKHPIVKKMFSMAHEVWSVLRHIQIRNAWHHCHAFRKMEISQISFKPLVSTDSKKTLKEPTNLPYMSGMQRADKYPRLTCMDSALQLCLSRGRKIFVAPHRIRILGFDITYFVKINLNFYFTVLWLRKFWTLDGRSKSKSRQTFRLIDWIASNPCIWPCTMHVCRCEICTWEPVHGPGFRGEWETPVCIASWFSLLSRTHCTPQQ